MTWGGGGCGMARAAGLRGFFAMGCVMAAQEKRVKSTVCGGARNDQVGATPVLSRFVAGFDAIFVSTSAGRQLDNAL